MKKLIAYTMVFGVMFAAAALPSGCGGSDATTEIAAGQTGRAIAKLVVEMTAEDMANITPDIIEKAATVGWTKTAKGFEKAVPAANATIHTNNGNIQADENGVFSLPTGRTATSLAVDINGTLVPMEKAAISSREAGPRADYAFPVPFAGDCCHTEDGPPGRDAMEGRCNDYNGWWSDGQNYPRSNWRAYRNFIMSDCDRAFFAARCWRDHYSGGCWAVHGAGGCSGVIGHSWDYHKHNFPH